MCMHRGYLWVSHVYLCASVCMGVFVCVCVFVCLYVYGGYLCVCALCISAHLSARTEVLGGALEGSLRPWAQLGAPVQCSLPCPCCPPLPRRGLFPSPSPCPEYLSTVSCNPCNPVLISNHFLQFAKWFLWCKRAIQSGLLFFLILIVKQREEK